MFGIWTCDFISDIIFVGRTFDKKFYTQGIISSIFVIIPWFLSMRQLLKSQEKWTNDDAIKYGISRWLLKYNKKLIILTGICGSCFAAVELCNARAFGRSFFNMGLTERHLKQFHGTRIYSTAKKIFFI